jgi:tRNA nucleotidyltransferase (CCA-adding enzyme)
MEIYLVGGAIRDRLLGLEVKERDWVVVGASPAEMLKLGYKQIGKDFPVFLHPQSGEEYALARNERKIGPGYTGFEFHAGPEVTLQQDLQRRDLTINAMAETVDGHIIDPWNGQQDLQQGVLRHISPAFAEDPVRILRVARLAARFGKWGFHVAHPTNALMREMVRNGEVNHLVPERVCAELLKALKTDQPQRFFQVLHGCGALAVLFPEIEQSFPSNSEAHGPKTASPALETLADAALHTEDPRIRFAVLMRALSPALDQHARLKAVQQLCTRYRLPNEYRQLAELIIELEAGIRSDQPQIRLVQLEHADAFRNPQRWSLLLAAYQACGLLDTQQVERWQIDFEQVRSVQSGPLLEQGFKGKRLGEEIRRQRLLKLSRP